MNRSKIDYNQEMVIIDRCNDNCKCQKAKQVITKAHQAIERAKRDSNPRKILEMMIARAKYLTKDYKNFTSN